MGAELLGALERVLGVEPRSCSSCAGGDINQAYRVELRDGRSIFVKTQPGAPEGFFASEARGLAWLAEAHALPVPEVIAVQDAPEVPLLALAWIDTSQGSMRPDREALGRGLARLHRQGAEAFGGSEDGFIGSIPQSNRPHPTWRSFYAVERLEPLLRQARNRDLLSHEQARAASRLIDALDRWLGPEEAPSRLHGDLWSGNVLFDGAGRPWLIDPAAYAGHREMDLAMLALFGGLDERILSAYEEEYPLAPGRLERMPLHQLYPLLVHVLLFGRGYVGQVDTIVRRYLG